MALAVCGMGVVAASSAQAGQQQFASAQVLWPGGAWAVGDAHSLTQVLGYFAYGGCVNAINVNGGQLAGVGACATAYWQNVSHPYCGCQLRDGVAYAQYETTAVNAIEYW